MLEGPKKSHSAKFCGWYDRKFKTPSGKFEFKSELCEKNGHTALPEYKPEAKSTLPFHLFTPHVQFGIHSQFINLDWMQVFYPEPFVYMHPISAEKEALPKTTGESV